MRNCEDSNPTVFGFFDAPESARIAFWNEEVRVLVNWRRLGVVVLLAALVLVLFSTAIGSSLKEINGFRPNCRLPTVILSCE